MPGFHALMLLRDEGDIIAQTLEHLLTWCDSLFIYDTGSIDNSWEVVNERARRDRRIVPVARESVLYTDGIRGWLLDRFRSRFHPGDWIARVDADEFYHIPPPQFIEERVSRAEGRIRARLHDFVITRRELKAWQDGGETLADRSRPIEERRRFFRFDDYPEQRLFRYRRTMRWSTDRHNPFNAGLLACERIPIRHYRARDPVQLQTRCALRAATFQKPGANDHWSFADWRHSICLADSPHIVYWQPGSALPEQPPPPHLAPPMMRLAQHAFYRSGLVCLRDRFRPRNRASFQPQPLTPEFDARLRRYLEAIEDRPYLRNPPLQARERIQQRTSAVHGQAAKGLPMPQGNG